MSRRLSLIGLCLSIAAPVLAEPVDILITDATIVTMDAERRVIENGALAIKGRDIVAIGGADLAASYEADHVINAGGDIVMPGMINLHNHISMVAFRGLGEYEVENLLFDVMFPLEKELLNRNLIHVSARQSAIELAMGGVTTFADMYYHEDEVARATKEVGLRGVLGETVIGFPVVDSEKPYGGLAYAEKFIQDFKDDDLITPAIAPHAPYTVDKEHLLAARAISDKYDVPMLMHMVEFPDEYEMVLERHPDMANARSEIAYLDEIGFLSPRLLAKHVIHLDDADMDLLKERGVGVAHNPKANSKAASGISPAWEMMKKGVDIGLGTDGPMSSNQMDILTVMHYVASVARLRLHDARPYTPLELVEMATIGGARALDKQEDIGSLEAGKRADLIIIDRDAPNMQPGYDVYAAIAFGAYPGNVLTTIVNGQRVMEDRTILTIDVESHDAEWNAVKDRVKAFAETLEGGIRNER
ncbi:amidohydrolase [Iodidimonas muriae]|uniref:Amidohydrolase n=1 Tax=Iodidimonas muriae TaxID=261467 RepID=A0ABQ2LFV7_9PROT|nr:amidohydrolase [Iodidimonas muriae]GER08745.1 amidohydrolase [Kordiimonadales bacterium JCM 17843]GGO16467.1 amidohydrolase [Iodidimonas muriae]